MIIDTTADGIRVRRKTSAEHEEEARAAKRRKAGNRIIMDIPTGPDEEVQAALAKEAAEQQKQLLESEQEARASASTSRASAPKNPETEVEWESRAAGVRDTITQLLGGKAWLTQQIGEVGSIQIRGNGGLCAVKNAIKAAQKLKSVKKEPKNGRIPRLLCRLLLKEFREVRREVKGKSYNTWFLTNFAKGDFDRVIKALNEKGEKALEDFRPPPFPQPREGSPEPTVRRLLPINGESRSEAALHQGHPPNEGLEQNDDQVYTNTDGNHYQSQDVNGGGGGEQQNGQGYHQQQSSVQDEFRPQDLAQFSRNAEDDAVEALIQSQTNVQAGAGGNGIVESQGDADAEGEEELA